MPAPTVVLDKDRGKHQGKVFLSLFGFKQQNQIDIQEIVTAIDVLPDFHLQNLDEIRFDPNREFQTLLSRLLNRPHINRFQAEYILDLRSVILYELKSKKTFFHTLYHEIGHHVYFNVIGSTKKKAWVKEIRSKEGFVTPYAKRNAGEDFAECYAFYKLQPDKLKLYPLKWNFMKKSVFGDFHNQKHYREYRF